LVLFQACSGGGNGGPSPVASGSIAAKLDPESGCFPLKMNNKTEVLLQCENSVAVWSEKAGLKYLPEAPKEFSISPANILLDLSVRGFSDDGKVLFSLSAPLDYPSIEEIPPYSYLFDGTSYVKLAGDYAAMSDNGQFVAGVNQQNQISLLNKGTPVEIAKLQGLSKVLQVMAVNNRGEIAATVSYGDANHNFLNYYAAKIAGTETTILPPQVRPDINSSSAVDINEAGDVLINTIEQGETFAQRALIVSPNKINDLYASNLSDSTDGRQLNNGNLALFEVNGIMYLYQEGKGSTLLEERIGQAILGLTVVLNDNNQVLIDGEAQNEFLIFQLE